MVGSPPKDRSAEIARKQQRERELRIRQGRANIEEVFQPFYAGDTAPDPQEFIPTPDVDSDTEKELQGRAQEIRDEMARIRQGFTGDNTEDESRRNQIRNLKAQLDEIESNTRKFDPTDPKADLPPLPTGGQFGGDFFTDARQEFLDFYNPQLEDQFDQAKRKTSLGLASRGQLESSAGARRFGDLLDRYNQQRQQIAGQALDREQGLLSDFEQSRANLIQQNRASADPSAAATSAAAATGRLQRQPTLSPLGATFADLINTGARGVAAERAGYPGFRLGVGGGGGSGASGSGSVRIVR